MILPINKGFYILLESDVWESIKSQIISIFAIVKEGLALRLYCLSMRRQIKGR